jgi:hypothetical protein
MVMDNKKHKIGKNQAKERLLRLCVNGNEWGEMVKWWRWRDLNPRHKDYDSSALPTELHRHGGKTAALCENLPRLSSPARNIKN